MKVLVATHITQGNETGDYCWAVDGELVTPIGLVCNNRSCGCERGFPGLGSSHATTTALVVDLAHIGRVELATAVHDSLQRGGWLTEGLEDLPQPHFGLDYADLDDDGIDDDNLDDDNLDEDDLDSGDLDNDDDFTDEQFIAAHVEAIIHAASSHPVGTIVGRDHDTVFAREALAA